MSGDDVFADERIQFFLRNRDDIKAWASIERDVFDATREFLGRSQIAIEDRLLATDPHAVVGRHDSGQWERILTRYEHWPATVGLALEWSKSIDPAGAARPKLGVFWWADPPSLVAPRTQLVNTVDRKPLMSLGYKIPLDSVWPVGWLASPAPTWWHEPDAWLGSLVDLLAATWPIVAPAIDQLLPVEPQASRA